MKNRLSVLLASMSVLAMLSGCAPAEGPATTAVERGDSIDRDTSSTSPSSLGSASGAEECLGLDSVKLAVSLMDASPEVSVREAFEKGHELGRFQCAIVIDERDPGAGEFLIHYDAVPFSCPTEVSPAEAADPDGPGIFGLLTEGAVSYEICVPFESRSAVISATYTNMATKNARELQFEVRDVALVALGEQEALRAAVIATAGSV